MTRVRLHVCVCAVIFNVKMSKQLDARGDDDTKGLLISICRVLRL